MVKQHVGLHDGYGDFNDAVQYAVDDQWNFDRFVPGRDQLADQKITNDYYLSILAF